MKRTILFLVAIVVVVLAAVALAHRNSNKTTTNTTSSTPTSSQTANNTSNPQTATIDIKNMMFTPSQITVAKGGTVTWTNNDTTTHTVVDDLSNAGGPNSGDIAPGKSYSFTFTKTGSFQYHCSIHPSMRGTIVVK